VSEPVTRDDAAGGGEPPAGPALVDWDVAASTAALFVGGGPAVPRDEAQQAVADLGRLARTAEQHVRELTQMGAGLPIPEATVLDRRAWVKAAAGGLDALTSKAIASAASSKLNERVPGRQLLSRGAGVQTGLALAFLGSKVLGQYEPFGDEGRGRLLLVAPNIVQAERALQVDPEEFRLWVCLHECTHRLQFSAVGWLSDYFVDEVGRFISSIDDTASNLLTRLPEVVREVVGGQGGPLGLVEALASPEQRQAFDRLIALSTLLEGHADFVMDAVGPEVVPSVASIRRKFTERRKGGGVLDRLLRGLLGIDAKIKQYEQGGAFARYIAEQAGMSGLNAVWRSPNTLPTRAEITEPDAWLRRINP
jgi:coenzyme F420 biosynthesis associated uncharacterized protein